MTQPEERSKAWISPQASIRSRTYGGTESGSLQVVIIGINILPSLIEKFFRQAALNGLQIYFGVIDQILCRMGQAEIVGAIRDRVGP